MGVVNGALREMTYGKRTSERTAQRVSTATLLGALSGYIWALEKRWPIPTDAETAKIGAAWLTLTVGFEFGLGRFVEKQSWQELLAAYDVTRGSLWPLIPLWTAVGPAVVRRLRVSEGQAAG